MAAAGKTCETPSCTIPVKSGFRVCGQCRQVVTRELLSLPGLCRHFETSPAGVRRGAVRLVAGLDEETARVRTEIVDILVSWCSLVVHERGGIAPGTQTVEDLAVFLDLNLRWLARHDAAADFTAEVGELASAARRIANRVAEDAQWVSVSTRVRGRAGSRRRTRRRTRRPA